MARTPGSQESEGLVGIKRYRNRAWLVEVLDALLPNGPLMAMPRCSPGSGAETRFLGVVPLTGPQVLLSELLTRNGMSRSPRRRTLFP